MPLKGLLPTPCSCLLVCSHENVLQRFWMLPIQPSPYHAVQSQIHYPYVAHEFEVQCIILVPLICEILKWGIWMPFRFYPWLWHCFSSVPVLCAWDSKWWMLLIFLSRIQWRTKRTVSFSVMEITCTTAPFTYDTDGFRLKSSSSSLSDSIEADVGAIGTCIYLSCGTGGRVDGMFGYCTNCLFFFESPFPTDE